MTRHTPEHRRQRHALAAVAVTCLAVGAIAGGVAVADQPHMRSALAALDTARVELQLAASNHGGHRVQALDLVNRAIRQVELGIEFAD